jgi:hypothetical protein
VFVNRKDVKVERRIPLNGQDSAAIVAEFGGDEVEDIEIFLVVSSVVVSYLVIRESRGNCAIEGEKSVPGSRIVGCHQELYHSFNFPRSPDLVITAMVNVAPRNLHDERPQKVTS